ncbi:MAG: anaerobic ribonucleoside-triphosphate reductase activating protein [candidate division WOR-3 bacterium]|jgi:pyruvate formate lyase activating enzyme
MRIVGFIPSSMIDWDGKITSVLFVAGCNFACPFCHNAPVADDDPALPEIPFSEIRLNLENKLGWLDGVVVTGGEPLMHPEIFDLLAALKNLNLKIKLDTNGSFPYPLKRAIALKLVDAVAMDIKGPLNNRYATAVGRRLPSLAHLKRSIRLLIKSGIEYEFRLTLVPGLINPEDITEIGSDLRGAKLAVLQQFVPENCRSPVYRRKTPYCLKDAQRMQTELAKFVSVVRIRGKFL